MEVEMRVASTAADRLASATLGHAAFAPAGSDPLFGRARRLTSPRRARATTWLALVDGEPASTLLAYDLVLRRGDELRSTVGFGSVATHPAFRKQGLASQLCSEVARRHGGAGLLFSAIDRAFYERLGYVGVPAWNFRCTDPARLADSGPLATLTPLDSHNDVERLSAAWREAHAGWYLDRDANRWATTLIDNPDDVWFGVGNDGYVRILFDEDGLDVGEICTEPDERDAVLRAAAAIAVALKAQQVTSWLEPCPFVREHFQDAGRAETLPMLLGIDAPETARFSSADYF